MKTQHTVDTVALVNAARAGDQAAQDALVSAYLPLVYNIVGRALNGSVDVDDVVQETMLRALGSLGDLRTPESFRSWLVAIAMNRVRAHRQDRHLATGAVEEAADVPDPGADFVDLTIVRLQLSGQRQETASATRWLEPEDREVLSLWWLECAGELTRAEVATALAVSPQHTAVRVQRMKERLESARVVVRALDTRPPCPELHRVLASWNGVPSALWRRRIARHARDCGRCDGLWSGLLPAEGLLAGLALVGVSAALLTATRSATASPAETVRRAAYAGPAGPGSGGGSGTRAGLRAARRRGTARDQARRRRRTRRRAVGGAVVAACVAGGGLWYVGDSGPETKQSAAARSAGAPAVDLAAPSAVATSSSPSPSYSKKPTPSKSPRSAQKTSTPTAKQTVRVTPSVTTRAPQAQSTPKSTVAQVVALVNQERAKAGCGPVTEDAKLDRAAQGHSDDMAARHFFDHKNPDGKGPGDRITAADYHWSTLGENIAQGQPTPDAVMNSWMHSPGHRANILNCSYKNLGVGIHNGSGGPWWTQDFAAKF